MLSSEYMHAHDLECSDNCGVAMRLCNVSRIAERYVILLQIEARSLEEAMANP